MRDGLNIIEIFIIILLLSCLIRSCSNNTHPCYEAGKMVREVIVDFKKGLDSEPLKK